MMASPETASHSPYTNAVVCKLKNELQNRHRTIEKAN